MKGTTDKIICQEGRLPINFLGPLMEVGLPLMKNKHVPLAKSILITFGLMVAASATDGAIQKKIYESIMSTLMISNKEMKDIEES